MKNLIILLSFLSISCIEHKIQTVDINEIYNNLTIDVIKDLEALIV